MRFTATAESERYARKRSRVAIRHTRGDQVVAILEIVSPGNKTSRRAPRSFIDKALELLDAGLQLLVVVGGTLPDVPLFIESGRYVSVPLETSYRDAYDAVPKRWREELASSPPG